MVYPNSVKVDALNTSHAEYMKYARSWNELTTFYNGGAELQADAENLLATRPKEQHDYFQTRAKRVTYTNIIAPVVDWYAAKLFSKNPSIRGDGLGRLEKSFFKNCDREGTTFQQHWENAVADIMLYGRVGTLIDRPAKLAVANRAQEKATNADVPYLIRYHPSQIIDWKYGPDMQLDFVKLKAIHTEGNPIGAPEEWEEWRIYDRQVCAIYRKKKDKNADKPEAQKVDEVPHVLTGKNRVPFSLNRTPGRAKFWLGNRVWLSVRDLFNQENTHAWHLFVNNLALPIIFCDDTVNVSMQEMGVIVLPADAKYGSTETTGTTIDASEKRCNALREEIYRQTHMAAQGRSSAATPAMQSGYSKELDMAPADAILEGLGNYIAPLMQSQIEDVALLMGIAVSGVTVSGFRFQDRDPIAAVEVLDRVKASQVPSNTLVRELELAVADEALEDPSDETRAAIKAEIDSAPTFEERQEIERERLLEELDASVKRPGKPAAKKKKKAA